jgi:heat shock protein HtpX
VYEQIASNKRRTAVLIVAAVVFAALIGYVVGFLWDPAHSMTSGLTGLAIAGGIAAVMSWGSYVYGDRLVLASTRAREVTAEEEPRLHNIVEGLAIAAGQPKPRVYIVPEQAPNAFATGRDPERSSIAVTQGLLDMMNRVELEGVIGHEMSHVADRDILVGTVVATVVGAAVLLAEFFLRTWWWGGGRRSDSEGQGGGLVTLVLFIIGFVLLALAPLFGQLIKLSVSRNREYLADAQGAMLTRYPPGLVSALRKLQGAPTAMRSANNATAHLWLNQPSRFEGEKTGSLEKLFSTHPPLEERIRRLEEM